jgi:hypothetical protein
MGQVKGPEALPTHYLAEVKGNSGADLLAVLLQKIEAAAQKI